MPACDTHHCNSCPSHLLWRRVRLVRNHNRCFPSQSCQEHELNTVRIWWLKNLLTSTACLRHNIKCAVVATAFGGGIINFTTTASFRFVSQWVGLGATAKIARVELLYFAITAAVVEFVYHLAAAAFLFAAEVLFPITAFVTVHAICDPETNVIATITSNKLTHVPPQQMCVWV